MTRSKKLKKNKLIWSLFIFLGVMEVLTYLVLYNGGVAFKKTDSTEVIQKLKDIQVKGGVFELTQKDINELSSIYFAKPIKKGDITLRGVNIEFLNGELLVKVPIIYKKLNLLLTLNGEINFSNGKIIYVADNFKIGKLPVPKSLVISQISKLKNGILYAENNLIKIDTSIFPFKIDNFKIVDNKMLITVVNDSRESAKKKELEKQEAESKKITQQTENTRVALIKVKNELSNVYSQVVTSKEQELISTISSTLSKMISNPSYNVTSDKASIISIYRTLNSSSRDRVKSALFWNIDGDSIGQLRQTFGL